MEENQFLKLGLRYANYNYPNKCSDKTNIKRFQTNFGCHPTTCQKLWEDLQTTPNLDGRINANTKPTFLLIGLRFLWRYQTEEELGRFFKMSAKTVRNYYHESAKKIYLLLDEILPPLEEIKDERTTFVISIDGTHCPINEPKPWSPKWSSHKLGGKAAVNYEVGLRINKPELAWVYGPVPAGSHTDVVTYRECLKGKLEFINSQLDVKKKVCYEMNYNIVFNINLIIQFIYIYICIYILFIYQVIADKIYKQEPAFISTSNDLDNMEVAKFKDRVLSRQESFNSLLKNFYCLKTKWRHGEETHGIAFKACCVVISYEIHFGFKTLLNAYP